MQETETQRKNIDIPYPVLQALEIIGTNDKPNGNKYAKNIIEDLCIDYTIQSGYVKRDKQGNLVRTNK
jgi:hypothetical protein